MKKKLMLFAAGFISGAVIADVFAALTDRSDGEDADAEMTLTDEDDGGDELTESDCEEDDENDEADVLMVFVDKEDDEDAETEVTGLAGGSGEQDGKPGDQHDEAHCACDPACCFKGPCRFKK